MTTCDSCGYQIHVGTRCPKCGEGRATQPTPVETPREPVDLSEVRERKRQESGRVLHGQGKAFAFYQIDESDLDGLGFTGDGQVCWTINAETLEGVQMPPELAELLGVSLIQAAVGARAAKND